MHGNTRLDFAFLMLPGVDFINCFAPYLRLTFEKLFTGVERALRRAPNFIELSLYLRLAPNFYEIDPLSTTTLEGIWDCIFKIYATYKCHGYVSRKVTS